MACAAGLEPPNDWLETADLEWSVLLAPAAFSLTAAAKGLRDKWLQQVLDLRGEDVPDMEHLDGKIPGWSWYPKTFSWLEPTAFAVISLTRNGKGEAERAQDGLRLIRDRVCVDGGWNYGNRVVLGQDLLSYTHSTAWALLAIPRGDELVPAGLKRLEDVFKYPSALSLSVGALAVAHHGGDVTRWVEELLRRQAPDGSFGLGRVDRTALAAVVLRMVEEGTSPFTGTVPHVKRPEEDAPDAWDEAAVQEEGEDGE